jgi:hypothetical protein
MFTTNIVAMSPHQTLWLCLHNKHCGYVSTTNIVAMSPQQTLWPCLHIKHCGYVSTTNIVAMSPQQTLWLCLHNINHCVLSTVTDSFWCGDVSTKCLLWRHSHNVCCGEIATMFDVGYVSTTNIVAMSPQQTLWPCLHNKHCCYVSTTNIVAMSPHSHNVCCGDIATMFVVET